MKNLNLKATEKHIHKNLTISVLFIFLLSLFLLPVFGAAPNELGKYSERVWKTTSNQDKYQLIFDANLSALEVSYDKVSNMLYSAAEDAIESDGIMYGVPDDQGQTLSGWIDKDTGFALPEYLPKVDGYGFSSWNTKQDGSGATYNAGGTVTGGSSGQIILYAQWVRLYEVSFDISNIDNAYFNETKVKDKLSFNITFEQQSGEKKTKVIISDIPRGSTISDISDCIEYPQDSKYEFDSWSATFQETVKSDAVYVANYKTVTDSTLDDITLSYHKGLNDGNQDIIDDEVINLPVPGEMTFNFGEKTEISIPNNIPTREGYSFAGWKLYYKNNNNTYSEISVDGSAITKQPKETLNLDENIYNQILNKSDGRYYPMYLVAQWTKDYKISYNKNAPTGVAESEIIGLPQGGVANKENNYSYIVSDIEPRLEGYSFAGWNTQADDLGDSYTAGANIDSISADITLYAQWTKDLKIRYFDGSTEIADLSSSNPQNSSIYIVGIETIKSNHQNEEFIGWLCYVNEKVFNFSEDERLWQPGSRFGVNITSGEIKFIAQWLTKHVIKFELGDIGQFEDNVASLTGGTLSEDKKTLTINDLILGSKAPAVGKDNITLTEEEKQRYEFLGWNEEFSETVVGDITYIANYKNIIVNNLTKNIEVKYLGEENINSGNAAISNIPAEIYNLAEGQSFEISQVEPTRINYKFNGWKLYNGERYISDIIYKYGSENKTVLLDTEIVSNIKDNKLYLVAQWEEYFKVEFKNGETVLQTLYFDVEDSQADSFNFPSYSQFEKKLLSSGISETDFSGWVYEDNVYPAGSLYQVDAGEVTTFAIRRINRENGQSIVFNVALKNKYTVRYVDSEGKLPVYSDQDKINQIVDYGAYSIGVPYVIKADAVKENATFAGWQVNDLPGKYFAGMTIDTSRITGELVLTATWEGFTNIKYLDSNGITLHDYNVEHGSSINIGYDRDGFIIGGYNSDPTFIGWKLTIDGVEYSNIYSNDTIFNIGDRNLVFKAQHTSQYTVRYVDSEGKLPVYSDQDKINQIVDYGAYSIGVPYVIKADAVKENATFAGWQVNDLPGKYFAGMTIDTSRITGELVLKATWEGHHTVTYVYMDKESNILSEYTKYYAPGETVRIDIAAEIKNRFFSGEESKFNGWYCDFNGSTHKDYIEDRQDFGSFTMPAQDVVITPVLEGLYRIIYKNGLEENSDEIINNLPVDNNYYYNSNSGSSYDLSSSEPIREGYFFDGWVLETDATNGVANSDATVINRVEIQNSDVIVVAKWTKKLTVTYNCGDLFKGEDPVDNTEYKPGDQVAVSSTPSWEEHEFVCWVRSDTGEEVKAGENLILGNTSITLTAKWANMYYINIVDPIDSSICTNFGPLKDGSIWDISETNMKYLVEDLVKDEDIDNIREGYIIKGVSLDKTATEPDKSMSILINNSDANIYIIWNKLYSVKYNTNTEDFVSYMPSDNIDIESGSQFEISKFAPMRDGYTFVGWNTKPDGLGDSYNIGESTTIRSNLELFAQWEEVPAGNKTITFVNVNDDIIGLNNWPSSLSVTENTEFDIAALETPTSETHNFVGWTLNGSEFLDKITVTENITLVAKWKLKDVEPEIYTVTYDKNCDINVNGLPVSNSGLASGEKLILPKGPTREDGYEFDYWSQNRDSTSSRDGKYPGESVYVYTDVTFFAIWKEAGETQEPTPPDTYTITFDKNCEKEVDNMPENTNHYKDSGDFILSDKKPVRAVDDGYEFKYWSVEKDETGAIYNAGGRATIDKDTTFFAIWKEKSGDYPTFGGSSAQNIVFGVSGSIDDDDDDGFVMSSSDEESSGADSDSENDSETEDGQSSQTTKRTLIVNHIYNIKRRNGVSEFFGIDTDKIELDISGNISDLDSHGYGETDGDGNIKMTGVVESTGNINLYKFIDTNFNGIDFKYTGSSLDDDRNMILHIEETLGKVHLLAIDLHYEYEEENSENAVEYQIRHEYYQSEDLVTNTLDGVLIETMRVNKATDVDIDEVIKSVYTDNNNVERAYKYINYTTREDNNKYYVVIKYIRNSSVRDDLLISGSSIERADRPYILNIFEKLFSNKNSANKNLDIEVQSKEQKDLNKIDRTNQDIDTSSDDLVDTGFPAIPCLIIILITASSILVRFGLAKKTKEN